MTSLPNFKMDAGIALLFAIPLKEAEFISRVSDSDWLRKFDHSDADTAKRQELLEAAWHEDYYQWVAAPFGELKDAAERLGAEVQTNATLATLSKVTAKRSVVVLFAHWKGPEISNDDFVVPYEERAFVERVRENDTLLGRWLLDRFRDIGLVEATTTGPARGRRFWPFAFASRRNQTLRGILRDALSVDLPERLSVEDGVDEVIEHKVTRAARRRNALDALFHGLLRPGNRLELFDGLHAKEVVESAIAKNFEGILDLATCTSTVLADFIAARRQFRLRTVQFPTVQEPLWAAKCVKATLELVAAVAGLSYLEARNLARKELEQALREI